MFTLAELATLAVLAVVVVGIAAAVLVCATRPCPHCRRRSSGQHYRAGVR